MEEMVKGGAGRPKSEYCIRGHIRSVDNLTTGGACRICVNAYQKERDRKKRESKVKKIFFGIWWICKHCGSPFITPRGVRSRSHCSRKCVYKSTGDRVRGLKNESACKYQAKTCPRCDKEFFSDFKDKKYCSRDCYISVKKEEKRAYASTKAELKSRADIAQGKKYRARLPDSYMAKLLALSGAEPSPETIELKRMQVKLTRAKRAYLQGERNVQA